MNKNIARLRELCSYMSDPVFDKLVRRLYRYLDLNGEQGDFQQFCDDNLLEEQIREFLVEWSKEEDNDVE